LTNPLRAAKIEKLSPTESGPVAQLGARFHGMEEVIGSIPIRSTNHFINKIAAFQRFSSLTASSNPGDKKAHSQRYLETLASGNEKAPRLQGAFRV
jgi:hypothetical protein